MLGPYFLIFFFDKNNMLKILILFIHIQWKTCKQKISWGKKVLYLMATWVSQNPFIVLSFFEQMDGAPARHYCITYWLSKSIKT